MTMMLLTIVNSYDYCATFASFTSKLLKKKLSQPEDALYGVVLAFLYIIVTTLYTNPDCHRNSYCRPKNCCKLVFLRQINQVNRLIMQALDFLLCSTLHNLYTIYLRRHKVLIMCWNDKIWIALQNKSLLPWSKIFLTNSLSPFDAYTDIKKGFSIVRIFSTYYFYLSSLSIPH